MILLNDAVSDTETFIKIFTVVIALGSLIKVLFEYINAQKWKKAEFLAKEVKEFFADESVKRALLILDWNPIYLRLEEGEIKDKSKLLVNDELFTRALMEHDLVERFNPDESLIRRTFDDFLTRFGFFQNYVDSKLIKSKDLVPYFNYWIRLIGDPIMRRRKAETQKQLWKFMVKYEYYPVLELMKSFGYDLKGILKAEGWEVNES